MRGLGNVLSAFFSDSTKGNLHVTESLRHQTEAAGEKREAEGSVGGDDGEAAQAGCGGEEIEQLGVRSA